MELDRLLFYRDGRLLRPIALIAHVSCPLQGSMRLAYPLALLNLFVLMAAFA